ncbi:MAG TPA: VOC family protein [Gaiella sp.]|nr:VOC family protein [Gaiella sp.]
MGRLVGINHVAIEVGSIEEALVFWEKLFGPLELRGRLAHMAFVDMGDQFVALSEPRTQPADRDAHVGIVVDDKEAVRARALAEGLAVSGTPSLDVRDPWGNLLQVVDYREVQFTKAPAILEAMGHGGLEKTEAALAELRAKGLL